MTISKDIALEHGRQQMATRRWEIANEKAQGLEEALQRMIRWRMALMSVIVANGLPMPPVTEADGEPLQVLSSAGRVVINVPETVVELMDAAAVDELITRLREHQAAAFAVRS